MDRVPLAARVVEVIADLGDDAQSRYRYGSGCVVRGRTVLTAAHVVAGAQAVRVRYLDKKLRPGRVKARLVGGGAGPDLALVDVEDEGIDLPAIELAVVARDSPAAMPVEGCHAVGYPWFAETPSPSVVRDTVDALGYIPVLSNLASGLLTVQVTNSPEPLPPERTVLGESQWSGMSGAPVIADECLLGVVSEHAPRAGPSAITAVPLSALELDPAHPEWGPGVSNAGEWWARLGVTGLKGLRRLPARKVRVEPVYWATVREIHVRTPQLLGREQELAELAAFATGAAGYRWLTGGPWTGKTALAAEVCATARPPSVDVVAYFLSRAEGEADSNRFIVAVLPQLAYLLDEDAPDPDLHEFRALWERTTDRAVATGRHVLLIVDGLDEDLRPRGLPSVASLLPAHTGTHAHVLVTSRPHFRPDVRPGHPLGAALPAALDPFPDAAHLADLARQEIDDLLQSEDMDLAADVLGVLTAAAGPLTIHDLATLTGDLAQVTPAWARQVDHIVTKKAARSLQPVGDRYQFAHGSLLEQAQTADSLRALRHPDYRRWIDRWAEKWRAAGWPVMPDEEAMTPRYLLDEYPRTLIGDPRRLAALLNDNGWLAAAEQTVGADSLLADVRTVRAVGPYLTIKPGETRALVFERILSHIADQDVRALAFPGLVVRRVTPDVICYVLAGPCAVDVPDDARAQELFDAWSREVQLMSRKADGSLVHRPDIRRAALPLLLRDQPGKVMQIHSAAVTYYQTRSDVSSRAEELYHRLCLPDSTESLDQRWQRGVEDKLATSLEDLPPVSQVYLASRLGLNLPPDARDKAGDSRVR